MGEARVDEWERRGLSIVFMAVSMKVRMAGILCGRISVVNSVPTSRLGTPELNAEELGAIWVEGFRSGRDLELGREEVEARFEEARRKRRREE